MSQKTASKRKKRAAHFILQGKGGVGKSMIASLLFQYLQSIDVEVLGIDTDPNNSTFKNYESLDVAQLDLLEKDHINTANFDNLIESITETTADYVIDNGANTFLPFFNYINENNIFNILQNELGIDVYIHTVITSGQAKLETLKGVEKIVLTPSVPKKSIFIWENEYFGQIDSEKDLKDYKIMSDFESTIVAGITIPEKNRDTFGKDISQMLDQHKTFTEVQHSTRFKFMSKRRIQYFQEDMYSSIGEALQKVGY